jgi:ammonia channel protein AmtB
VASLIGVGVNVLYVGIVAAVGYVVVDKLIGNRVTAEEEVNGLDLSDLGIDGYATEAGHTVAPEAGSVAGDMASARLATVAAE